MSVIRMSMIRIKSVASGALLLVLKGTAAAQCAMCKATLAGDPDAVAASHRMNIAVLLLLVPAIVMFSGFFVLMYRYRNSFGDSRTKGGRFGNQDHDFDAGKLKAFRPSSGSEWL
jgi:hypothetical protein